MRIVLNATPLLSPLTGIGQYIYQLAKGLQATPELEIDFFYALSWSKTLRDSPAENIVRFKSLFKTLVPKSYAFSRLIQQKNFNQGVKSTIPTVYHEPSFLPLKFKGPTVITVHDLSWIRFPETHPKERVRRMNRYFEPGLKHADLILTDSEFVKTEIMDVFGIASERIKAISLGAEGLFHPRSIDATQAVLSRHQLVHGQYFLSVGTLEPRKNIQATLRAYMQLSPAIRKQFPLVLVGMKGWNTSDLEQQIEPLIQAGDIRQIGYLPREELAIITAGATSLVYPSLYEGFGLPVLEAMSCAVPVISSNRSSLPEVVGDTGFLIDPLDIDALTKAMEVLATAPDIQNELAQKSLQRSMLFSWKQCAAQTVDAYRQVLGGL